MISAHAPCESRCKLLANSLRLWLVGYMLTRSEFVAWLRTRLSAGHSLTAIGRDLGVSRQAVQQWLSGATQPSRMALMLAEQLYRAPLELPLELAPGLPLAARRDPTELVVRGRVRANAWTPFE
jgi:hypothetical protein